MAYEDFTTFTESDDAGEITVTSDTITFTNMLSQSVGAVYKSQSINASFKYRFHFKITAFDTGTGARVGLFGVSDGSLTLNDANNNDEGIFVQLYGVVMAGQKLYLSCIDYKGSVTLGSYNIGINTDYYLEIERNLLTNRYYIRLYSDSDFSTLLVTYCSYNIAGDGGYSYLIGLCGGESATTGKKISGFVKELIDWKTEQVATPTANPDSSLITSANIALSCSTSGANIYYTTDGSTPTESSTLYSTPIAISSETILKAKAFKTDYPPSEVGSFYYFTSYNTNFRIAAYYGAWGIEGSKAIKALDQDMDLLWSATGLYTGTNDYYSIAVDINSNCLYHIYKGIVNGSCKIQRRSLTDGSLICQSTEIDDAIILVCVDSEGYLWTSCPYSEDEYDVIVFNPDLTVYKSINLSGDNHNAICYLAISQDLNYVYLAGNRWLSDDKNIVIKYSKDNLFSGDDYEWITEITGVPDGWVEHICIDDNDDVYVTLYSYWGSYIPAVYKVLSDGTMGWNGDYIEGDWCSWWCNDKLYTFDDLNGDHCHFRQYNANTGVLINKSADVNAYPNDIAIEGSGDYIYGYCYAYSGDEVDAIRKYDTEDWIDGETDIDSYITDELAWQFGDPTGYINYNFSSVPTPSVENRVFKLTRGDIVVKTKPFIEEMSLFTEDKYNGKLRITDSDIIITNTEGTPLGTLLVEKDLDFRVTPYLTTQRVDVAETDFELTEDGNNLYIKPKTTTKQLKAETENIILNQNVWR